MPIAEIFSWAEESDTEKVKFGDEPDPEAGITESAVGAPPVTVQPPTVTQPEFDADSAA
jgi:hypothetical protein